MHGEKLYLCLAAFSIAFSCLTMLDRHSLLTDNSLQTVFQGSSLHADFCILYDFVFLVGTGRSGSTTLMAFLNGVPGIHISGENNGLIDHLAEVHSDLNNATGRAKKGVAWTNTFDIAEIEQDMRNMIMHTVNPSPGSKTIGFKEYRTLNEEHFNFTRRLFPCAKFIVNIREDVSSQSRSGFYKKLNDTSDSISSSLAAKNQFLKSLADKNQDHMFLITLEEFSTQTFDKLLTFLGFSNCRTVQIPNLKKKFYTYIDKLILLDTVECNGLQQRISVPSPAQLKVEATETHTVPQPQESRQLEKKVGPNVILEPGDFALDSALEQSNKHKGPIVIRKFRLIFFHVPKVACEEFKKLFRRVEGYEDWATSYNNPPGLYSPDKPLSRLPHDPEINGLTYLTQLPLDEANKILNDPTWTKAIFLRDPITRFLSAYLDKIRRHNPNAEMRKLSFEEFITKVEQGLKNRHWNPQSQFYDLDKWLPVIDFVGSFESLAEDTETLLRKLGAWEEFGANGWGEDGASAIFRGKRNELHSGGADEKVDIFYSNATTKNRVMALMAPDLKYI